MIKEATVATFAEHKRLRVITSALVTVFFVTDISARRYSLGSPKFPEIIVLSIHASFHLCWKSLARAPARHFLISCDPSVRKKSIKKSIQKAETLLTNSALLTSKVS